MCNTLPTDCVTRKEEIHFSLEKEYMFLKQIEYSTEESFDNHLITMKETPCIRRSRKLDLKFVSE